MKYCRVMDCCDAIYKVTINFKGKTKVSIGLHQVR